MSTCPRCQSAFSCAMADHAAGEPCWCMKMKPVPVSILRSMAPIAEKGCLCPECLQLLHSTASGNTQALDGSTTGSTSN